jgi:hypothetical protein
MLGENCPATGKVRAPAVLHYMQFHSLATAAPSFAPAFFYIRASLHIPPPFTSRLPSHPASGKVRAPAYLHHRRCSLAFQFTPRFSSYRASIPTARQFAPYLPSRRVSMQPKPFFPPRLSSHPPNFTPRSRPLHCACLLSRSSVHIAHVFTPCSPLRYRSPHIKRLNPLTPYHIDHRCP